MDALELPASRIADVLLDKMPAYVSEDALTEIVGLSGYAVRWYVHQLRRAGLIIRTAMLHDRDAFARGERGWSLVDIQDAPSPVALDDIISARPMRTLAIPRKGMRVFHDVHGEGRIIFHRAGFPKAVVAFGDVTQRVEAAELLEVA